MQPVRLGSLRLNICSRDNAVDLIRRSVTSPLATSACLGYLNPHVYNLGVTHPPVAAFLQRCDAVCLDGIGATIAASLSARARLDRVIMHQLFDFSIAAGLVRGPVILFGLECRGDHARCPRAPPGRTHGRFCRHSPRLLPRSGIPRHFARSRRRVTCADRHGLARSERILLMASEICRRALCWHVGGGTLKQWAGTKRRAPAVVAQLGLEWLHRICFEPQTRARYTTGIPLFVRHLLSAGTASGHGRAE